MVGRDLVADLDGGDAVEARGKGGPRRDLADVRAADDGGVRHAAPRRVAVEDAVPDDVAALAGPVIVTVDREDGPGALGHV